MTTQNSSTMILSKNKKLATEFLNFEKKVAYFTLTTLFEGKQYPKTEIGLTPIKIPETASPRLLEKIQANKDKTTPIQVKTLEAYDMFFGQIFKCFKSLIHGSPDNFKAKQNILVRLKEMFNSKDSDSSIIVYTGPFSAKGTIPLETPEYGFEEITFNDVYSAWKERTSQQKCLLLILDCSYGGKWQKELAEMKNESESVSILSATKLNQKNTFFELGTVFSYNIIKTLQKNQTETLLPSPTDPSFFGDYLLCKKYTNLYLKFDSWSSIASFQKSDFMSAEYNTGSYFGHMVGGQKQFWGTFVWKTGNFKGSKYTGEFEKGKLQGKGFMFYNNGRVFEGDFINNYPEGFGTETYENGDIYIGKFAKGFKSGHGVYKYKNGDKYEGNFVDNKPHGKGILILAKGARYEGSFVKGKCSGNGEYKYENGDVYKGEWSQSVKHGQGVYTYANGNVYTGSFLNGVRHGQGKLNFPNGDVYEGGWDSDAMNGEGKFKSQQGVQRGEWVKGKLDKLPKFFDKKGGSPLIADI